VRDGIITHNGEDLQQELKPAEKTNDLENINDRKAIPSSYEGCIIRFADVIAYLGRDIEDAYLANIIKPEDIPKEIKEVGAKNGQIIDSLVVDLIKTSKNSDCIKLSDEMFEKVETLQNFNYNRIYNHPTILNYRRMGENIIEELFDYLLDKYNNNGKDYKKYKESELDLDRQFGNYIERYEDLYNNEGNIPKVIVCDYIAGMTDNYALNAMKQIKIPEPIQFN
jgi:dGTPase